MKIAAPDKPKTDNIGPCKAANCRERCQEYVPAPQVAHWPTCQCGHTKQIHERIEIDA